MKTNIILLLLTSVLVLYFRPPALAQDVSLQPPAMANPSLVPIPEIKSDIIMPLTIRTSVNDEEFSSIVWRGLTMHYIQSTQLADKRVTLARIDRGVFNSFSQKPAYDEKHMVRQAWSEAFGFDVWMPYYKAKEVEGWVKKKVAVKVFKLKGEAAFEKGHVMYTFKTKF